MRILDLFAGYGGFSYGAEKLVGGYTTTQFVEKDEFCQKILKKHWPNVPIHDDINTFNAKPNQYELLTIGWPCQDISVAGNQRGIKSGTRSSLFYQGIRLLRELQPRFALFENVRNLIGHDSGKPLKKSSSKLPKAGTMRNGKCYPCQNMQEEFTGESAYSLLPTPNTFDYLPPRGYESMVKQTTIHRKGRTKLSNLREAVNPYTVKLFNALQAGQTKDISLIPIQTDIVLNPQYVEQIMGLPVDYTKVE